MNATNASGGPPVETLKTPVPTLRRYLQEQALSKTTVDCYLRHTLEYISFLDRENVEAESSTPKEITAFIGHLKKRNIQPQTLNVYTSALKHFFDWQIECNKREDNPATHIKLRGTKQQKLYPILSQEELQAIAHNYKEPEENDPRQNRNWWEKYYLSRKRNKVILSLMVNQGLTTAEITKLELTDLKLQEGKIEIPGSRKSEDRVMELKSHQMMGFMQYVFTIRKQIIEFKGKMSKRLFPSVGKNTDGKELWKWLTKEIKEQHPKFINFKQVRASVITHWLGKYNLREVQYMAGHRNISSTEKYKVGQLEDLQSEIELYHPMR